MKCEPFCKLENKNNDSVRVTGIRKWA